MANKEEGAVVPASSVVEEEEEYEEEEEPEEEYEEEEEEEEEEEDEEEQEEVEEEEVEEVEEEVEEEEEEEGEEEQPEEEEAAALTDIEGQGERIGIGNGIGNGIGIEAPHSLKKSMDELRGFHSSLTSFLHKYNDLERYLLSVDAAIDAVKNSSSIHSPDSLCNAISSRSLRRYIQSHMDEITTLRQDVPLALKRAEDPPKLVLESIGRFYLQGSRAYDKGSHQNSSRNASLLILEFFLLAQCLDIQPSVKQEADAAALSWRKRILAEGGFAVAHSQDARGLLLFIASYGIPSMFKNDELGYLFWRSFPIEIAPALRLSPFLKQRMPVIIQEMIQKGMCVAAVYGACVFGMEDKYPPDSLIESFLRQSNETWKKSRSENSPAALKEANRKHVAGLKSVIKCLNDCNVDATKFSEYDIEGQIGKLEKDITDVKEEANAKRKADDSKKMGNEKEKRFRPYPKHRGAVVRSDRTSMYDGRFSGPVIGTGMLHGPTGNGGFHGNNGGGGFGQAMEPPSYYVVGHASTSLGGGAGSRGPGSDLYQFADSF